MHTIIENRERSIKSLLSKN